MKKVYIFLANGFEEIEALTVVDILRRGKVDITTVSIEDSIEVLGSHGIKVIADELIGNIDSSDAYMLILPGGGGTKRLKAHMGLAEILKKANNEDKYIAAICAAPSVLALNGILNGKKATCYPTAEAELENSEVCDEPLVIDGKIITAKAAGAAFDFALTILSIIEGIEIAETVKKSMFL